MRGLRTRQTVRLWFLASTVVLLRGGVPAYAGWEIGLDGVADSNVTRAVHDETADSFLHGALSYSREVSGDRRLDWTAAATVDGALYGKVTELDYVAVTVAPGITYVPRAGWTLAVSTFLQGKSARDGDQSALAWGARCHLEQRLGSSSYLTEHYAFTDSKAREDVFSYREHALGALIGHSWTPALSTELAYQYAHGDSFRTLTSSGSGSVSAAQRGTAGTNGGGRHGIHDLGGEVIKETVNTHEVSVTLGYSWAQALMTYLGGTVSVSKGSAGTSRSQIGCLGVAYRF